MFLNRDQVIAMDFVRSIGFEPVQAIILTSHNRNLRFGTASVLAIKDGRRYNIRVGIDTKTCVPQAISAHELSYTFDYKRSTNMATIDGCAIKDVVRKTITL